MIKLLYPFKKKAIVTQTFAEHVQRAIVNGHCYKPGTGCKTYYYPGIDLVPDPPIGCPCHGSFSGKGEVIDQGEVGYGLNVRILSGKYLLIYAHLSSTEIKTGQDIKAGDIVGYTGWSGNVWNWQGKKDPSAAHLHFELREGGIPINPEHLFVGYPVDTTTVEPIIEIKIGDTIKLKDKYDYVNIRSGPNTKYIDCGDFLPKDIGVVVNKDGMWLCIFALKSGFGLWVHGDYVEKV